MTIDWETYEIPDIILYPPTKYDLIKNEFGVCGKKPNLYYNESVHRIWVTHAVDGVESLGSVEEYVDEYGGSWSSDDRDDARREMIAAVNQALDFYREYEVEFDQFRRYREHAVRQMMEENCLSPVDGE